jgi:hypothetical protein
MIDQFQQDLWYGLRSLARNRAFTAVFLITLGLGIGSCTAIFSLMSAVMFPPLPYGDRCRIARTLVADALYLFDARDDEYRVSRISWSYERDELAKCHRGEL